MAFDLRSRKIWLLAGGGALTAVALGLYLVSGGSGASEVAGDTEEDRLESVDRLARSDSRQAGAALADAAANDPSPTVRTRAIVSLMGRVGNKNLPQREKIREALEQQTKDGDPKVRQAAVAAVGLYRDQAAADCLIDVLRIEEHEAISIAALHGLKDCPVPVAIVALVREAEFGRTGRIKLEAMKGAFHKTGARLNRYDSPNDRDLWARRLHRLKSMHAIRDAFALAGVPL